MSHLVHVQWARLTASDYITVPVADWVLLPKKDALSAVTGDAGLIAHVCVLGQMMGEDNVSVEILPDGRLCLCGWSDNAMPDGSSIAKAVFLDEETVETVRRYSPRDGVNVTETMRGPRTTKITHCDEKYWPDAPIYTNPGVVEFKPLSEWVPPRSEVTKHGILLSNKLWDEHNTFEPPDDDL